MFWKRNRSPYLLPSMESAVKTKYPQWRTRVVDCVIKQEENGKNSNVLGGAVLTAM